ncbi:dynamin family protein [Actinoplanes sp. NPDC051470]|uniref:dynamin family protein n=1 Tax=Actinoplanes sp. NPDC051470 TaxID=3157224 RepID=UPI003416425F
MTPSSGRAAVPVGRSAVLLDRVARLADDLRQAGDETLEPVLDAVAAALTEPLRVAVVGVVKAGKSTLVNALIGRDVAPTAVGECTSMVTWYCFGEPSSLTVHLRDGHTLSRPLPGDRVPADVGVPAEQVARLEVRIKAPALRQMTLIDTPGLSTLTRANDAATRLALLGDASSRASTSEADAVLFAFRDAERESDIGFLRAFRDAGGGVGGVVNALGVLTQADLFGSGPWSGEDPFALAAAEARRLAERHPGELVDVVPVSGLLAQTAQTGALNEADARALAALRELDPALLQVWEQAGLPGTVRPAEVRRLFDLLGPYGVTAGRNHAGDGLAALWPWVAATSGLSGVEAAIRDRLVQRSGVLKVARTMARLEAATAPGRSAGDHGRARELIEAARVDPVLHPLRELAMLHQISREHPASPLRSDLERLVSAADDRERVGLAPGVAGTELAAAAQRLAGQARARAASPEHPGEADAARVLVRSYHLVAGRAR